VLCTSSAYDHNVFAERTRMTYKICINASPERTRMAYKRCIDAFEIE